MPKGEHTKEHSKASKQRRQEKEESFWGSLGVLPARGLVFIKRHHKKRGEVGEQKQAEQDLSEGNIKYFHIGMLARTSEQHAHEQVTCYKYEPIH